MWAATRVLILGHAGFVGANLYRRLLDFGADVSGFDLVTTSPSLRVLGIKQHDECGDVTDVRAVTELMSRVRPTHVFMLAGKGDIADCQASPYQAFAVNTMGTVAVLEAVRRAAPTAAILCASSNTVYASGTMGGAWRQQEDGGLRAVDMYGTAKISADLAVRAYRHAGLRALAVRHVNSYGPADPHATHLVTLSILSCLRGAPPMLRGQGTAVKGYLHIADVVAAYLLLAERIEDLPLHVHAVNVTGELECEASVRTIMQAVCDIAGLDPAGVIPQPGSVSDQEGYDERLDGHLLASLCWRPSFSLYAGLADTYRWYREHGGTAWLDDHGR